MNTPAEMTQPSVGRQRTDDHETDLDGGDEPLPVGTLQVTDDEIAKAQKNSKLVNKLLELGPYGSMTVDTMYGLVVINTRRGRRYDLDTFVDPTRSGEWHNSTGGQIHSVGERLGAWMPRVWQSESEAKGSSALTQTYSRQRCRRPLGVRRRWASPNRGRRVQHTAENVAAFLMEEVALKVGVFCELLTDGAAELTGHAIELLMTVLQARQINPMPYRPQMIGLDMENTVATFMTAKTQNDWNLWVKFAVYSYKSAQHSTVALTSNELMMGRRLRTPNELLRRTKLTEAGKLAAYHDKLLAMIHENAERARVKEQKRQAKYYDRNSKMAKTWKTGDRVWLYNTPRGPLATKFVHKWMGPLRIVESAGYENFLLEREDQTGEPTTLIAHSSFLITYLYPRSLLEREAEDLDAQLEHENLDETTRNESTNRAPVRTATPAGDRAPRGSGTKPCREAMAASSRTQTTRNRLVKLRRRRRRIRAGQYVLEYLLHPIDTGNWTLDDGRWWIRNGLWQDTLGLR
ncbi:LOW QUALITY PROTEIN: hypothetical protein PHMEG_00031790 [Phytophthora megakarya]|uniref:Integrase catalytic domain-containing protein n=1 Tax=Phytophthora megakarya TaxID=4795 RepID=A0A225UX92_9STRA|nr:LOW QUALITY PROTEIN: hypothetical protein PHMEG_00031790 [Phytophthora megakarya]